MDDHEWRDRVGRVRGTELGHLRHHWDMAYRIWWGEDEFHAQRLDNGSTFSSGTAQGLLGLIRADYIQVPVPREGGILP